MQLNDFGVLHGSNVMVHTSFRNISRAYGNIKAGEYLHRLKEVITESGSVILPAFTYCFKKSSGDFKKFDKENSHALTGFFSEYFRTSNGVIRTSSPTHSFSLWGKAARQIDYRNSPASPLGTGSVPDWMAGEKDSFVMMAGTDFSSLTFLHYLENISGTEYINYSPWDHLNIIPKGVSLNNEQDLIQIPGCSRNFINFENFLITNNKAHYFYENELRYCIIRVNELMSAGLEFLSDWPAGLLCPSGKCIACDSRRPYSGKLK